MRIRSEALDYECITKAISLLPKLSKAVYGTWIRERWDQGKNNPSLPDWMRVVHLCWPDSNDSENSPTFWNFFRAMMDTPNHITTIEINWILINILEYAIVHPAKFDIFCTVFRNTRELKLVLSTDSEYEDRGEQRDLESVRAILDDGVLGRLVSIAKSLRRLKLNVSRDRQRRGLSDGGVYNIPLSAYLGENRAENLPDLKYIYLASFDTTEDELIKFFCSHRKLQYVDLDRVVPTKGHWTHVSVVFARMFRYREQTKHHKLAQVEPVVEFVRLPKYLEDLLGGNVGGHEWEL
jgi:hypothetical protein